ncbi:ComEC/Rec2 family competence protein [Spiroplasma alleghenense]|uniref:Competence protein ComEC n=1 Tax=Spiroplasma alleghenense TaxID=216931 RepID=A0A345Z3H8_9MOLU|nr:hypothetical protein [Spiroplasma alleghenense]AXK51157.1 competence protein ComEC [Spiroplasma alleghenense]
MKDLFLKFTPRINFNLVFFALAIFIMMGIVLKINVIMITGGIAFLLMVFYLVKKNFRYLLIILILLISVFLSFFVNQEYKMANNSLSFTVFNVSKNYSILSNGGKKFLFKEFENEKQIGQTYKMKCECNKIANKNNIYQFNFQKLMLSKNVIYELKNCQNQKFISDNFQTKLNAKKQINSDWMKSINNLEENDLTISFKNLGISFLLNSNGYLVLTGYYFLDKIFRRWKKYHKIKIILYLPLLFNLVLLNFSVEISRILLILFINYFSRIWKLKFGYWNKHVLIWSILLCISPNWFLSTGFIYSLVISFFNQFYLKMNCKKNVIKNLINWSLTIIPLQIMFNYNILFLLVLNQFFWQPLLSVMYLFTLYTNLIPGMGVIYNIFFSISLSLAKIGELVNLSWNIGHIESFYYVIYYLIYYIICKNSLRFRSNRVLMTILIAFSIFACNINNAKNNYNFIAMINVGNGNSFLLHEQGGKNIFFDIGSGIGKSKNTDSDFLKYYGLNVIEAVFISHTDQDHNNNIDQVSRNTIIKNIYKNDFYFRKMIVNDISIQNFEYYNEKDPNDSSQVLLLNWRNKRMLFTGDLPKRIESQLVADKEFYSLFLNRGLDFLQVPHHGSKTSSSREFINLIKPKICFISGENKGRLHFPDPITLNTLQQSGCITYATLGINTYKYLPFTNKKSDIEIIN